MSMWRMRSRMRNQAREKRRRKEEHKAEPVVVATPDEIERHAIAEFQHQSGYMAVPDPILRVIRILAGKEKP